MTRTTLYFAYGSNLCAGSMARRCPDSIALGPATLPDWRLTFRGVADVEPAAGDQVLGGLWLCPPRDEAVLDSYEGVSGGFYRKDYLTVVTEDGEHVTALVYVMCPTSLDNCCLPSQSYLNSIIRGYRDFALSSAYLDIALERTYERVIERKGITEFVAHGPKRLGPAGTERPVRVKAKSKDAPGQKSQATLMLDALEQEERRARAKKVAKQQRANLRARRRARDAEDVNGDSSEPDVDVIMDAVTTRTGRALRLAGEVSR